MTIYQIIDTFTYYGVDVLLLAAATTVLVQICKLTFLKNVQKKLFTFLPFVFGTLLYAAYAAIRNLDFFYIFTEYVEILEHGLSVGTLATLYYVLYEQFVRKDGDGAAALDLSLLDGTVAELIKGFVPEDSAEEIAEMIADEVTSAENGAEAAAKILESNASEGVTSLDIELLSRLIALSVEKLLNG